MARTAFEQRERDSGSSAELSFSPMTRRLRIQNQLGLHARPAVFIVRLLRESQSRVTFSYRRHTVDANSVLGLLMLAAPRNAWITVSADGPDAQETLEKLEAAFLQRFGEEG